MSYSIEDAKREETLDIALARASYNYKELERIARIVKKRGDDELAELLIWEAQDMKDAPGFDEARESALSDQSNGTW